MGTVGKDVIMDVTEKIIALLKTTGQLAIAVERDLQERTDETGNLVSLALDKYYEDMDEVIGADAIKLTSIAPPSADN